MKQQYYSVPTGFCVFEQVFLLLIINKLKEIKRSLKSSITNNAACTYMYKNERLQTHTHARTQTY